MKILIVEDEALIVMRMEIELATFGHQLCPSASTGRKAIEIAQKEVPELIIMDLNLIGPMNGIEAAREIQREQQIPIIFMTGYADEELKTKALELEPLAYLVKPVEPYQIENAINYLPK